jgi:ribosomal-protein-alanine N-acetyltransferase
MTVLKTPRLDLREFEVDDALFFYELNNDPLVVAYTGDLPFESVAASRRFIKKYDHYSKHGYGRWMVILRKTGEPIGFCGLKKHHDGYIDLGYRIIQSEWGKGYATEAAQACVAYGFSHLGMDEIIGRTAMENPLSIRVLEKVGMKFWKHALCEGIEDAASSL